MFSADEEGNYTVTVTSGDISQSIEITVNKPQGVTSTENKNYKVYPNPAANELVIEWEKEKLVRKISISDVSGKLIKETRINQFKKIWHINTSDMKQGYYLLHVHFDDHVKNVTFIR
jgi:hypothetical protein